MVKAAFQIFELVLLSNVTQNTILNVRLNLTKSIWVINFKFVSPRYRCFAQHQVLNQKVKFTSQAIWMEGIVFGLCVRWGFPALKLNSSMNFNLRTND